MDQQNPFTAARAMSSLDQEPTDAKASLVLLALRLAESLHEAQPLAYEADFFNEALWRIAHFVGADSPAYHEIKKFLPGYTRIDHPGPTASTGLGRVSLVVAKAELAEAQQLAQQQAEAAAQAAIAEAEAALKARQDAIELAEAEAAIDAEARAVREKSIAARLAAMRGETPVVEPVAETPAVETPAELPPVEPVAEPPPPPAETPPAETPATKPEIERPSTWWRLGGR